MGLKNSKGFYLTKVIRADGTAESYRYGRKKNRRVPLLESIEYPDNKVKDIDLYDGFMIGGQFKF